MRWTRVKIALAVVAVLTVVSMVLNINEWLPRLGVTAILVLLAYELVIGSTYAEPETKEGTTGGKAG